MNNDITHYYFKIGDFVQTNSVYSMNKGEIKGKIKRLYHMYSHLNGYVDMAMVHVGGDTTFSIALKWLEKIEVNFCVVKL